MIVLDTHIWVWWAAETGDLSEEHRDVIAAHRSDGLGVSATSCWEMAKLAEYNRLELTMSLSDWMRAALGISGVQLIEPSPQIAIESTQLQGAFTAIRPIRSSLRRHECAMQS